MTERRGMPRVREALLVLALVWASCSDSDGRRYEVPAPPAEAPLAGEVLRLQMTAAPN